MRRQVGGDARSRQLTARLASIRPFGVPSGSRTSACDSASRSCRHRASRGEQPGGQRRATACGRTRPCGRRAGRRRRRGCRPGRPARPDRQRLRLQRVISASNAASGSPAPNGQAATPSARQVSNQRSSCCSPLTAWSNVACSGSSRHSVGSTGGVEDHVIDPVREQGRVGRAEQRAVGQAEVGDRSSPIPARTRSMSRATASVDICSSSVGVDVRGAALGDGAGLGLQLGQRQAARDGRVEVGGEHGLALLVGQAAHALRWRRRRAGPSRSRRSGRRRRARRTRSRPPRRSVRTTSIAGPPGPPGLTNSAPSRFAGSVARCRTSASARSRHPGRHGRPGPDRSRSPGPPRTRPTRPAGASSSS